MYKSIKLKYNNTYYFPYPYFPIGYVYISTVNVNPSTWMGGVWEQIKDVFLLGCGSLFSAGSTGGSNTHSHTTGNCTLNINQIPSHRHHQYWISNDGNINPYVSASSGSEGGVYYKAQTSWYNSGRAGVYTGYQGSSQSHNHGNTGSTNHMPPYLAVYMWKRVS